MTPSGTTRPGLKPEDAGTSGALDLSIWLRLLACSNLMLNWLRRNLRHEFGMTLPTFDILAQIARPLLEPTMGELSERLMVSKGSVTDLIERLERRDLVARRPDPHGPRAARRLDAARQAAAGTHHSGSRQVDQGSDGDDRSANADRAAPSARRIEAGTARGGAPDRAIPPVEGNTHDLRARPTGAAP